MESTDIIISLQDIVWVGYVSRVEKATAPTFWSYKPSACNKMWYSQKSIQSNKAKYGMLTRSARVVWSMPLALPRGLFGGKKHTVPKETRSVPVCDKEDQGCES